VVENMHKVSLKDVSIFYGKLHVVKHVSADFPEKEITAIIGPSGSGKSTLLRSLNRMNDHISGMRITGEAIIDGQNIYANGVDVVALRRKVGMVFQRPNPFLRASTRMWPTDLSCRACAVRPISIL